MRYYKLPTTFLWTLAITSFLKALLLRSAEPFTGSEPIPIPQILFFSFLFSCGLSLASLLLSNERKFRFYKFFTVIGGRENSPKAIFTDGVRFDLVGSGHLGRYGLCGPMGWPVDGVSIDLPAEVLLYRASVIKFAIRVSFSGEEVSDGFIKLAPRTELGVYLNRDFLPELEVFDFKGARLEHPFEVVAFGYASIVASSIAQNVLGWVFEPSISSSLTTTAIGRRAVTNQILFLSLVQGLAALLMIPWLSNAPIVPLGLGTVFLYLGFSSMTLCDIITLRISRLLPAHQNLGYVNWLASILGAMFYSILAFQAPEETKSLFSFSDVLLIALVLASLFLTHPNSADRAAVNSERVFVGLGRAPHFTEHLRSFLAAILASQDSRQIFYFLLLNLSYMFVQLAYGFWTNSLGLISDAIHMFFDCVALGVGLFAAVTSKWPKNKQFSYGYSRIEVLSGFSNGIFLALISVFIVLEAVERLIHPPEMNTDRLLLISFLGLVVNLIGILAFNHGHHGHSHSAPCTQANNHTHDAHTHNHVNHEHGHHKVQSRHAEHDHGERGHTHGHYNCSTKSEHHGHSHNMEGVFLHILADTLGSVGVIVSTLLIKYFGWTGFDPLASIFIAVLIFFSVLPLIKSSFAILLLYVPPDVSNSLRLAALQAESALSGECKVLDAKIWPNDHESYVATVAVALRPGLNPISTSSRIEKIFLDLLPSVKALALQLEVES
ncbi:hypothetical protein L0F63_001778 [Massospora cicadina]|nr:hypothetical protein L0F63_001778 [Massospora cicadina]